MAERKKMSPNGLSAVVILGTCLVAFFGFMSAGAGFKRIDAGEIGVRFDAARGTNAAVLQPRFEFYWPTERLITYPSSLMTSQYLRNSPEGDRSGDDSVVAQTTNGTQVNLDVSIYWRVQPDQIAAVFENFGEQDTMAIRDNYLRPMTYVATNTVIGRMTVEEVLVLRRGELNDLIKEELVKTTGRLGITIEDVNIGEIYPAQEVRAAIDELVSTRNQLQLLSKQEQTAKEDAKRIITEAEQKAEQAKLLSALGDKAILSKKLEIARIRAERWNGSETVVGPKTKQ